MQEQHDFSSSIIPVYIDSKSKMKQSPSIQLNTNTDLTDPQDTATIVNTEDVAFVSIFFTNGSKYNNPANLL